MTAKRAFGRRAPGLRATARSTRQDSAGWSRTDLTRAYVETEDFARSLYSKQQDAGRSARGALFGGLALALAVGLALPFVTDIGAPSSEPGAMTVAELDALTPEQLAQLSPAAGGQRDKGLLNRLLGVLSN